VGEGPPIGVESGARTNYLGAIMRRPILVLGLFWTACSGAEPTPVVPSSAPLAEQKMGVVECTPTEPSSSQPAKSDKLDPDVLKLAEAAKSACAFESSRFDWGCAQYKAFVSENDDLFESAEGNVTLLSMLESSDLRMRVLAAEKGFLMARAFFSDKAAADRLLKVVKIETDEGLLRKYGRFVAAIPAEKLGLQAEFEKLVAHPSASFRQALVTAMLPSHPTDLSLALVKKVIAEDVETGVRRAAVESLAGNGRTKPTEAICATLKGELARTDVLALSALEAGVSSKCAGLAELSLAEIEKRTKAGPVEGLDVQSALRDICWDYQSPVDLKKRAFDVAARLAPKLPDSDAWTKRSYIRLFRACDIERAKSAIVPFSNSKDKAVATSAKEELNEVEKELKRAKERR
jgi:hypothetical protein